MYYSNCRHCGEEIHRWEHSRQWYNGNESATCDNSPIGKHQWDGKMEQGR